MKTILEIDHYDYSPQALAIAVENKLDVVTKTRIIDQPTQRVNVGTGGHVDQPTHTAEGEREAYERWARPDYLQHIKLDDGSYRDSGMQAGWCAWQARAELSAIKRVNVGTEGHIDPNPIRLSDTVNRTILD